METESNNTEIVVETERRWTWRIVAIGFTAAAVCACALAAMFGLGMLNSGGTTEGGLAATTMMTVTLGFATSFAVTGAACGVLSIKE